MMMDNNCINLIKMASFRFLSDDGNMDYFMRFIIFVVLIIYIFPLTFCDLYFGLTDDSCVNNSVDRLAINLADYLVIGGIIRAIGLFFLLASICCFNEKTGPYIIGIGMILFVLGSIFGIAWNIIGGVIFWSYMDNSTCSDETFNYVFASLIIKYVITGVSLFANNNNNNNKKN